MLQKLTIVFMGVLLLAPAVAGTVDRAVIAVIFPSDIEAYRQAWEGIQDHLKERGVSLWASEYVLDRQDEAEIFSTVNDEKPDAVVAMGTKVSLLARERVNKDIPVVFCMVFDPQTLVGPNITGASMVIPDDLQLREIRKVLPNVKKVGLIYSPNSASRYQQLLTSCQVLGFHLVARMIDSGEDLPEALEEVYRKVDCLLMIPDSQIYIPKSSEYLLLESLRKKFPVVGLSSFYTKAGALFSVDCDYQDLGRQAAQILLRILDGDTPKHIKPSIPRKVNLSLNLVTAERLGITIPPGIVKDAKEVFER